MATSAAPAHVPRELVWDYDFKADPLFDSDPVTSPRALTLGAPDIFYSTLYGGFWVLTRFDDIREASRQPDVFSNYPAAIPATLGRSRKMAPIEIDPPDLDRYRMTLAPAFSPARVKEMEDHIRAIARELIEEFAADGGVEFVDRFSSRFPVRIFMHLIDVPHTESEKLRKLLHTLFWSPATEDRIKAGEAMEAYCSELVSARQQAPGEDLISRYITAAPQGRPFSFEDIVDGTIQLFVAGLDTVTNSLSLTWKYLAEHPEAQAAIHADPAIIAASAADEMLRFTSLISSTRTLTRDVEFRGLAMKAGERVLMPLNIANRDAEVFPDGGTVHFDRKINNHLAFGAGPHRCLGSHLAKLEMVVAMEEWFSKIPRFGLDPADPPLGHGGHAIGISRMPLLWRQSQ